MGDQIAVVLVGSIGGIKAGTATLRTKLIKSHIVILEM